MLLRAAGLVVLVGALLCGCSIRPAADADAGFHLAQIADSVTGVQDSAVHVERVTAPPANEDEWQARWVDPASTSLRISWVDGVSPSCGAVDRAQVRETATTVVIGLAATHRDPEKNCVAAGVGRKLTVALLRPLGGRALLEGVSVNDGLAHVADPDTLPTPRCGSAAVADVPAGFAGAAERITPATATAAVICRTSWPHGRATTTTRQLTSHAAVAELLDTLARQTVGVRAGAAAAACSTRQGAWFDVYLLGPRTQVQVHVDTLRCTVSNGAASGHPTAALDQALDHLAPAAF